MTVQKHDWSEVAYTWAEDNSTCTASRTCACSAAETENFAKTAQLYNVPPASISQSIKRLENELGNTLFDRSANTVKLNERGKIYYQMVKASLSSLEEAKKAINTLNEVKGHLKLLVATNRSLVNEAVKTICSKYKGVTFYIENSDEKAVIDSDDYDLIITDNFPFIKNNRRLSRYNSVKLISEKLLLAVHKDNPLSLDANPTIADLLFERIVTLSEQSGLYYLTRHACNRNGFSPNLIVQNDDPSYVVDYIEKNIGVSLVPEFDWRDSFSENVCLKEIQDLKQKTKEDLVRVTKIYYSKSKSLTKLESIFIKTLIEIADKKKMQE